MNLPNDEFDAVVEDITKSLDKFEAPVADQAELLMIMERMRNAIAAN